MTTPRPSSRERIIDTAERLFAEHGLEGATLRQIAGAAGNANNSAVQYHFGSKDQLLQAIFEQRLPRLSERRRELLAGREPSVRSSVEAQVRALLEESERDDSHYVSFVAMLLRHGRVDVLQSAPQDLLRDAWAFTDDLQQALDHLAEPLRGLRVSRASNVAIYAAADRQRARQAGHPVPPFELELATLVDGIVGFLAAPMSPEAQEAAGLLGADAPLPPALR